MNPVWWFEIGKKTCHVVVLWYPTHNLFKGSGLVVFGKKNLQNIESLCCN